MECAPPLAEQHTAEDPRQSEAEADAESDGLGVANGDEAGALRVDLDKADRAGVETAAASTAFMLRALLMPRAGLSRVGPGGCLRFGA